MRFNLFIFSILILLFISCNKNTQDNSFGVSISAPNILNAEYSIFSENDVNDLKMINNMHFFCLNKRFENDTIEMNYNFSLLYLFPQLVNSKVLEDTYEYLEINNFKIDRETLLNNLLSIQEKFFSMDSSILIKTFVKEGKSDCFSQSTSFPIIDEDVLKTKNSLFNGKNSDFFSLSKQIRFYEDDKIKACDINIGNGSYSLLLIEPKSNDIATFAKSFSEGDYSKLVNKLETKMLNIIFPNISFKERDLLLLPSKNDKSSIIIDYSFDILKPTRAELEVSKSTIDNKISVPKNLEKYAFTSPLLFFVRGVSTNAILCSGMFIGK